MFNLLLKNETPSILDEDMRVTLMQNVTKIPRRDEFYKKKVYILMIRSF